jgi:hypothetical protein
MIGSPGNYSNMHFTNQIERHYECQGDLAAEVPFSGLPEDRGWPMEFIPDSKAKPSKKNLAVGKTGAKRMPANWHFVAVCVGS